MKYIFILLTLLSFNASAVGFSGSFLPSASQTTRFDQYRVVCGALATSVRANIEEEMPIQPQIQYIYASNNVGTPSAVKRDPVDGDHVRSQWVNVAHVGGYSYVTIQHVASGTTPQTNVEYYKGDIECKKSDGTASTTSIQFILDQ